LIEASFHRQEGHDYCTVRLRVIEIKAGQQIQPKHRIQLGLYAIMMSRWFESHMPAELASGRLQLDGVHAGVWLLDARWYECTDIDALRGDLSYFLLHDLVPILDAPERARRCGNCRVCTVLAQALRTSSGTDNLVGQDATASLSDMPLTRLLTEYDVSVLQELGAQASPPAPEVRPGEEEGQGMTVHTILDALPRHCKLYLSGPYNDPLQSPIEVVGIEVEGDPGWTCKSMYLSEHAMSRQDDLDAAVRSRQLEGDLGAEGRTALAVFTQEDARLRGVVDSCGKWMAHECIHLDFKVVDGWFQKEEDEQHQLRHEAHNDEMQIDDEEGRERTPAVKAWLGVRVLESDVHRRTLVCSVLGAPQDEEETEATFTDLDATQEGEAINCNTLDNRYTTSLRVNIVTPSASFSGCCLPPGRHSRGYQSPR
jgi:hypothetical protein